MMADFAPPAPFTTIRPRKASVAEPDGSLNSMPMKLLGATPGTRAAGSKYPR